MKGIFALRNFTLARIISRSLQSSSSSHSSSIRPSSPLSSSSCHLLLRTQICSLRFHSTFQPKPRGSGASGSVSVNASAVNKYRQNEEIKAESVLVISSEGTNLGTMTLEAALSLGKEKQANLIEVSKQGQNTPVCKLVPFGATLGSLSSSSSSSTNTNANNNNNHNNQPGASPSSPGASPSSPAGSVASSSSSTGGAGAGPVGGETKGSSKGNKGLTKPPKEVKVGQEIELHDLQVKVNKIKEFLAKDLEVKITILSKPRRAPSAKDQSEFLNLLLSKMEGLYVMPKSPKHEGRHMSAFVSPKK